MSHLFQSSDLLVRWVSCCGNESQQNCQRERKREHRHLCKICNKEKTRQAVWLGRGTCQRHKSESKSYV